MILDQSADIFYGAKATTDLSVEDFWDWCRERTLDIHHEGQVHFLTSYPNHAVEIARKMLEGKVDEGRFNIIPAVEKTRKVAIPATPDRELVRFVDGKQVREIIKGSPERRDVEETVSEYLNIHSPADQAALKRDIKNPHDWVVIYKPIEDVAPFQRPTIFRDRTHVLHQIDHERSGVFEAEAVTTENIFSPLCELEVPPVEVIVEDLMIKGCIHVFAGMPGGFKSMWGMELAAANIAKRKASDQFEVYSSYSWIWACRDMDPSLQKMWAEPFGLAREEVGDRFKVINTKCDVQFALDSPSFTSAVRDHILILDTMWDFADIKNAAESAEWVAFFQKLHRLIEKFGCIAIILLVHPTKAGAAASSTELAAWLKDSITFAGKADIAFALSGRQGTSQILVERIKGRGFKKKDFSFTITTHSDEGINYLDSGRFPVYEKPGEAGTKKDYAAKRGPKGDPERDAAIEWLMSQESVKEGVALKAERLNRHFKSKHPLSTVKTWLLRGRKERAKQKELLAETIKEIVATDGKLGQRVIDTASAADFGEGEADD